MWTQVRVASRYSSASQLVNRRAYLPFVVANTTKLRATPRPLLLVQASHFATKSDAAVKEKERAKREKDKLKKEKEKEKEKEKKEKEKEKEKLQREKEKEKEKLAKEKEREKEKKEKEKEKEKKEKEKEKLKKEKEKEKEKALALKQKQDLLKEQEKLKPKRSRSSYTFYVAENFGSLRKQYPNEKPTAITKRLSEQWASLSENEKKQYNMLAEADKERNKVELEAYKKTLPPKRPLSSYLLFCQEKRAELLKETPTLKAVELAKILGNKWKEAPESEKEHFRKRAEAAKREYEAKLGQE